MDHNAGDNNLAPHGTDNRLRITRSDGKVYVAWTENTVRESVAIDEMTAEVTDARGWAVNESDAKIINLMLQSADMAELGRRVNQKYRGVERPTATSAETTADEDTGAIEDFLSRLELDSSGRSLLYDRSLRPISTRTWALLRTPRYLRVEWSHIADRLPPYSAYDVSTVWIGTNMSISPESPLVFETMVFAARSVTDNTFLDEICRRYPDEQSAQAGHEEIVTAVRSLMRDPVVLAARSVGKRVAPPGGKGKRRRTKPYRGMSARARSAAQSTDVPLSGRRRVRGKGGKPDCWVEWFWDTRIDYYLTKEVFDPVLTPVPYAPQLRRRYLARRRRKRQRR